VALAPSDFGVFSHRLLIGNFGDGTIHAFNAVSGDFEGTVLDASGQPLTVDGLWALGFGSNGASGSAIECTLPLAQMRRKMACSARSHPMQPNSAATTSDLSTAFITRR